MLKKIEQCNIMKTILTNIINIFSRLVCRTVKEYISDADTVVVQFDTEEGVFYNYYSLQKKLLRLEK